MRELVNIENVIAFDFQIHAAVFFHAVTIALTRNRIKLAALSGLGNMQNPRTPSTAVTIGKR